MAYFEVSLLAPSPTPLSKNNTTSLAPPPPPSRQQGCTLIARGEICLSVVKRVIFVVQCFVSVSADIVLLTWQSLFC